MFRFHVNIQGREPASSLNVTFEEALERLANLPRLFIELDGSFVWTGATANGQPWQVDGNLIDRGDVLAYVELKGCCSEQQFNELLTAFGWPQSPLGFQLVREGLLVDEADFRRVHFASQIDEG